MSVSVEPLVIGHANGPRVYVLVRRVGKHLDIEQMPDDVTNDRAAHAYAAKRWKIPECDVRFRPVQVVSLSDIE